MAGPRTVLIAGVAVLLGSWLALVARYTASAPAAAPERGASIVAWRRTEPAPPLPPPPPPPPPPPRPLTEQLRAAVADTAGNLGPHASQVDELVDALRGANGAVAAQAAIDAVVARRQRRAALRAQLAASLAQLATDGGEDDGAAGRDTAGAGDGVELPETSTVRCTLEVDGTDTCEYTNVCVDLAGPLTDGLRPTFSLVAPPGQAAAADAMRAAHLARGETRGIAPGERTPRPEAPPRGGDTGQGDLLRRLRAAPHKFDPVFMDLPAPHFVYEERLLPLHGGGDVALIPPAATVSAAHPGGAFNGTVAWVDSAYFATAMLGEHMWGCAASVMFPLLSAAWANTSRRAGLPPLDNLVITAHDGASTWYWDYETMWELGGAVPGPGAWCRGFLNETLAWLRGGAPAAPGKRPSARGEAFGGAGYPVLDAVAAALGRGGGGGGDACAAASALRLPFDAATLRRPDAGTGDGGTRITWGFRDVPPAPPPVPGGAAAAARCAATGRAPAVAGDRGRLCARRGVVLGRKPLLLGGDADAAAFRVFASSALGVRAGHAGGGRLYASPLRALLVDRGRDARAPGGIKPRGFANRDGMTALLTKYGVLFDVLEDSNATALGFAEQARVWGSYGLIVTGHGAAEVNLVFAPARAVVIEVAPYGLWCPMYTRLATAIGLHSLAIQSRLKGPGLNYSYVTRLHSAADLDAKVRMCEALALPDMQALAACVVEYKVGGIVTPLLEFEHVLTHALELLGRRTYAAGSALDLLEGAPDGGPGEDRWRPGLHEEARAAGLARVCTAAAPAAPAGAGGEAAPLPAAGAWAGVAQSRRRD